MTDFKKLGEPFKYADLEFRLARSGEKSIGEIWARSLTYITNRAIMDRLDDVCGPENWRNEFAPSPGGLGILCGLSIRVGDEWVTKWDGAEQTQVEAVKGGLSASMKRAAVQWGIGRYLYHLEEAWANVHDAGQFTGKTKEGKRFKWDPPAVPAWALPSGESVEPSTGEVTEPKDPKREQLNKLYFAKLKEIGVSEFARKAYQELHPDLPDSCSDWDADHYQKLFANLEKFGPEMFTKAEEKYAVAAESGELKF